MNPLRFRKPCNIDISICIGLGVNPQLLKRAVLFAENEIIFRCHAAERGIERKRADFDTYELFGFRIWQRFKNDAVHNTENCSRSSDPKCKGCNCDNCEPGRFLEHPQAEANILDRLVDSVSARCFATFFSKLSLTSKLDPRESLGL